MSNYERDIARYHAQNKEAKNAQLIFGVLVVIGALWYFRKPIQKGAQTVMSSIRGVRNNNFLNIKHSAANKWQGMTGADDKGFVIFSDPLYGLRAGFVLLKNYRAAGNTTLRQIISRFAPPIENKTENYISYVANKTGINPDLPVYDSQMIPILQAMVKMESGQNVSVDVLNKARAMV